MGFKYTDTFVGFSTNDINLANTGSVLVFTDPDNRNLFFTYKIRIYLNAGTNVSGVPTISIGTNSSSYNNILANTSLTGLLTNGTFLDLSPTYPVPTIGLNQQVFVNTTVGATSTQYGVKIVLYGNSI